MGYTGPNCDQDCQCNLHSTCSQVKLVCLSSRVDVEGGNLGKEEHSR